MASAEALTAAMAASLFQWGWLGHPQQEERRQNDHRDGEVQRRHPQRHGDGQRTEGDVAQAVADHGVPLQHQRNAQQRGAQAHQHTGDQRPVA